MVEYARISLPSLPNLPNINFVWFFWRRDGLGSALSLGEHLQLKAFPDASGSEMSGMLASFRAWLVMSV